MGWDWRYKLVLGFRRYGMILNALRIFGSMAAITGWFLIANGIMTEGFVVALSSSTAFVVVGFVKRWPDILVVNIFFWVIQAAWLAGFVLSVMT